MQDVLLIDDDVELCSMLTDYLGRHEYRVSSVHRGDTGLLLGMAQPWSFILVDVMLPGLDGFEIVKRIRAAKSANILLLTARGDDVDRIVGLEIGADDYVPKPFNPRELLARMRAIQRRSYPTSEGDTPLTLRVEDLRLESAARIATLGKVELALTDVEFMLLEALMQSPGKVISREALSERILGRSFHPFDRSLDMHVSRLRRKLKCINGADERVKTVRGIGYQLVLRAIGSEEK